MHNYQEAFPGVCLSKCQSPTTFQTCKKHSNRKHEEGNKVGSSCAGFFLTEQKAHPLLWSHILILPMDGNVQKNTFHVDLLKKGTTTNKAMCSTKCSATIDGQCQIAISQQATGLELIHLLNLIDQLPLTHDIKR